MTAQSAPEGEINRSPAGLYLLFEHGTRPMRSRVLAALDALAHVAVSHDPASSAANPPRMDGQPDGSGSHWLELLIAGMTFDLLGMAPGPALVAPQIAHRIGCETETDLEALEALVLVPGPHLADGANSLPIVRAMLELGCGLAAELEHAKTLCWSPARTAMPKTMFCASVEKWIGGGPVPGLGLTSFAVDGDGLVISEGLDFFVGQELRFSRGLSQDRIAATRLGVRLVHEIVGSGHLEAPREVVIAEGNRLFLQPDVSTGLIEVSRM